MIKLKEDVMRLLDKKLFQEAFHLVDEAILNDPDNYRGYFEKARIYARQAQLNDAIRFVNIAIELNNEASVLYSTKGRWLLRNKMFLDAYECFSHLIYLEKKFNSMYYLQSGYFHRAIASWHLKYYQEVLDDCEKISDDCFTYIIDGPYSKLDLMNNASKFC